jgi:glycosyltransferase involved in cell wall biosynthesis
MDALVLPSYREGFPTVCLEAAAAGKPVITTTATGATDAIEDGVTGRHVPPRDTERLCAAMAELASDRPAAARMGARGRQFVAADFTNARVWSELQRFLQEPLAKSRNPGRRKRS